MCIYSKGTIVATLLKTKDLRLNVFYVKLVSDIHQSISDIHQSIHLTYIKAFLTYIKASAKKELRGSAMKSCFLVKMVVSN